MQTSTSVLRLPNLARTIVRTLLEVTDVDVLKGTSKDVTREPAKV